MAINKRCGLLTAKDYKQRLVMTVAFTLLGAYIHWGVYPVAAFIAYTIYTGYCPIRRFVNKDESEYFKKKLPDNNPAPVAVFNSKGELLFQNVIAKEQIQSDNLREPIIAYLDSNSPLKSSLRWSNKDKEWIIQIKELGDEGLIFAYYKDITEVVSAHKEILQTQKDIVYAMGEIGETRSKETGQHVKRVAEYSALLARLAGLEEDDIVTLKTASPMHDIGKVGISDSILKKPGKLDIDEFEVMKTHTTLGYDMLNKSDRPILKAASIIALSHHEKWDGTGYPKGLKEEEIHIYGRITAIADVFDALGSKRVYKAAWPLEKILNLLKKDSGSHFDPNLIALFMSNLDSFIKIRDKYKDI